jgi:hypothetical protein
VPELLQFVFRSMLIFHVIIMVAVSFQGERNHNTISQFMVTDL